MLPVEIVGSVFNNGYRYVTIGGLAGRLKIGLHVLVCETFHGPEPNDDYEVAHADGIKLNNEAENLSWKTPKGNAVDRERHGNTFHGESHPMAKLSDASVMEIRRLKRLGLTGKNVGARFGLNRNTVNKIAAGKYWAHLP